MNTHALCNEPTKNGVEEVMTLCIILKSGEGLLHLEYISDISTSKVTDTTFNH